MSRRRGGASWWRLVLVIVLPVLVSAAAAVAVLFDRLSPGTPTDWLDTVRTGLAVAAGIGALFTLALALRRQQATEHDATERRLTELYVKAVDQLGSDKPAVRHGGFYALERVAQRWEQIGVGVLVSAVARQREQVDQVRAEDRVQVRLGRPGADVRVAVGEDGGAQPGTQNSRVSGTSCGKLMK